MSSAGSVWQLKAGPMVMCNQCAVGQASAAPSAQHGKGDQSWGPGQACCATAAALPGQISHAHEDTGPLLFNFLVMLLQHQSLIRRGAA